MELFLTPAGEVTCRPPGPQATVADLLRAMEKFCLAAIDCTGCTHTCCAGLIVYADNVFARKLTILSQSAIGEQAAEDLPGRVLRLDPGTRRWYLSPNAAGRCRFLAADGRCLIYLIRPLVCRLHLCLKSEAGFGRLKDYLYHAYRHALACEMAGLPAGAPDAVANPLIGAADYDTAIRLIVVWSQAARPSSP